MKASETWEGRSGDYTEGWSALAAGGLELHRVPGTHFTMMREPHVAQLAEQLRSFLAKAERVWSARSALGVKGGNNKAR